MENRTLGTLAELAGHALDHVTHLPVWSLAAHLVVGAVVVLLQQRMRGSRRFSDWNEFLCTLLWITWTLETSVISFASSNLHGHFYLFLRLLLWPLLSHDACVNPLNSVYLAITEGSLRSIPHRLGIQLVAMVTGLVYSVLCWHVLGNLLSEVHLDFMSSRLSPFLNVTLSEGFLLELTMSFVMYLPRLVMSSGFTCTFVSAVLTCVMILCLEHTTGAFMNPLVALSSSLLWHYSSLSPARVWEMTVVYWIGPLTGTVLVARLDLWMSRQQKLKLHSS